MLLKGKKAVITGGTSGIGKEIALQFVKEGADVCIVGTNQQRAKTTEAELKKARLDESQQVYSAIVDVSKTKEVESFFEKLSEDWETIDILVNNAGITKDSLLLKMDEKQWDDVLEINLKSIYNTCHYAIRRMIKKRYGKIINISSVVGLSGNAGQTNYAASKAGMIGFTKALAKEVAKKNISVNVIAPGYIVTPMTESLPDNVKKSLIEAIPMKRLGEPLDIATVAVFLSSAMSDYITGQVLTVDGGMVM